MSDTRSEYKALDCAVSYIDKRRRTERQVRDKLKERGFSEDDIEFAVRRLNENLLLGDEAYARDFISSRLAVKPMSSRKLLEQLIRNGIPRDMAHEAIAELDSDTELENACDAARKILGTLTRGLNPDEDEEVLKDAVNKTIRRLMSRGFKYEHARAAAEQAAEELYKAAEEKDGY